jgi:tetratricopeptide (TPR) repeat protein
LGWYRKVIQQFPDYARIDEVMYYLGRGALKQGKESQDRALIREGVQFFQRLVQNYPQSRFIAQTHLALGEHFFETDSLYYAKTNYEKIINNYTSSPMFNYALYKLGWVYFNLGEFRKTLDTFQRVVAAIGNEQGQVSFREQALNDLVKTWAEMDGVWREALAYFQGVLDNESDVYRRMETLAGLYVSFDKDGDAMELYNHFIERTPTDAKVVEWFDALLEVRKKRNDFAETEAEIRRILAYFVPDGRWVTANTANQEESETAHRMCEGNLLELSTHFHTEGQKADRGRNQTLARELYAKAAADYKQFLERFPDSTKAYLISFNYAEILYGELQDYENALAQYQLVIEAESEGEYIEDAALGVIYSSYELMVKVPELAAVWGDGGSGRPGIQSERLSSEEADAQRQSEQEDTIEKTDLHRLEQAYVSAADQYVSILLKLREDEAWRRANPDRGERIPEIMFLSADAFYRHGQFRQAVDRLNKIFAYDPNHRYAAVAAVTMIKAYYRLRRWARVEEWARKLIEQRNFQFKSREDLQGYIAIAIHENSMDLSRGQRHDEAIAESMRLVNEFRRRKELASAALMNVAVLYRRARRVREAVQTYERVAREYRTTDFAPEAQFAIGELYESQTRFEDAAEAFMKLGTSAFKDFENAPTAVRNAGLIREALEDYRGSIQAFEKYLRLWPDADDAASAYMKIGKLYEAIGDKRNLEKAVRHYGQFARKYPSDAVQKLEAYSRTGDILRRLDVMATNHRRNIDREGNIKRQITRNRRRAVAAFQSAIAEQPAAVAQIATLPAGPEQAQKSGEALHYFAQAQYWLADYVFRDFDAAEIPSTLRPTILRSALIEKGELLVAAEGAFDQLFPRTPADPFDKHFLACAAYRNGLLYYNFAKELFEVPIPFGLSPEQEDEYRAILEEIGAPVQEKALILLQGALSLAHEKNTYNQCAKDAGGYASRVNPEGYPISDEPEVTPTYIKDTLLSANIIRILRRGNVAVDMNVRTTDDPEAPPAQEED